MSTESEDTPLLEGSNPNPPSEINDVKRVHYTRDDVIAFIRKANEKTRHNVHDVIDLYTRDDVIGFLYSVLSGFCLAVSAVFVKLLQGKYNSIEIVRWRAGLISTEG